MVTVYHSMKQMTAHEYATMIAILASGETLVARNGRSAPIRTTTVSRLCDRGLLVGRRMPQATALGCKAVYAFEQARDAAEVI